MNILLPCLKQHTVVCLVGSASRKWKKQYQLVQKELCLAGYVVLSVSLFKDEMDDIEQFRGLLESIHCQKIRMADVVVVVHKDAIGSHTAAELEYCKLIRKPVVIFDTAEQTVKEIENLVR